MSPETVEKIGIAVFSAAFGWAIAQLTATVRTFLHRRKVIKLLHEELGDLDRETTRLLYYHSRNLQLYGAQGVGEAGMVGLSNPIYTNYYKDALLSLKQNQRISLQMIHGLVLSQNEILKDIDVINSGIRKDYRENGLSESIVKGGETLGELTKHGYSNCAIIKWHIEFHLARKSNPDLSPGTEDHRRYLQYLESVVAKMEEVIESGKTVPMDKFEKIYSDDYFEKASSAP